nr:hypothetical protein [Burkholderia territorii]
MHDVVDDILLGQVSIRKRFAVIEQHARDLDRDVAQLRERHRALAVGRDHGVHRRPHAFRDVVHDDAGDVQPDRVARVRRVLGRPALDQRHVGAVRIVLQRWQWMVAQDRAGGGQRTVRVARRRRQRTGMDDEWLEGGARQRAERDCAKARGEHEKQGEPRRVKVDRDRRATACSVGTREAPGRSRALERNGPRLRIAAP